jgi:RNA polymerase sigma-70 factor (ECF subfamily)
MRANEPRGVPDELLAVAREAWPGLVVDDEAFCRHLEGRLPEVDPAHVGDLRLAFACARGDARALALLDEQLLLPLARSLRKICRSSDEVDEVRQLVRTRMLVGDAGRPRILDYRGHGPLAGWLRVAAVRLARDLRRRDASREAATSDQDPGDTEVADDPRDPELALMKARYGRHFQEALQRVLADLPDRERNILAMSILDGVSTDAIGKVYGVDGSTVRRWVTRTRERVLLGVRAGLQDSLKLGVDELESLMGAVASDLDLNMSQLFAARAVEG